MATWIRDSETFDAPDERPTALRRAADLLGLLCLIAALVLLSSGVRIARADEANDANLSVDPKLAAEMAAAEAERPRAIAPPGGGPAVAPGIRPGVAGVEIAPGVIRLNTRGYNYRSAAGGVEVPPARPAPGVMAPVPASPAAEAAPPSN